MILKIAQGTPSASVKANAAKKRKMADASMSCAGGVGSWSKPARTTGYSPSIQATACASVMAAGIRNTAHMYGIATASTKASSVTGRRQALEDV